MERAGVSWQRTLAHGLALGAVMLAVLMCRVPGQRLDATQHPSDPLEVAPPASIETATVAAPIPRPPNTAQGHFAPAVERWRSMSREATNTVQHATGIPLDEDLVLALVTVESDGRAAALSARGAVGLTQVEPATYIDLRRRYRELFAEGSLQQPAVNLLAGALYLADCARSLGADLTDPSDLALVLHAYNLGPRAATEWRDTGAFLDYTEHGPELRYALPAETLEHSRRILALYGRLSERAI